MATEHGGTRTAETIAAAHADSVAALVDAVRGRGGDPRGALVVIAERSSAMHVVLAGLPGVRSDGRAGPGGACGAVFVRGPMLAVLGAAGIAPPAGLLSRCDAAGKVPVAICVDGLLVAWMAARVLRLPSATAGVRS